MEDEINNNDKTVNINDLRSFFSVTESDLICKVGVTYFIGKDYENVTEIDDINRTVKQICNFILVLHTENGDISTKLSTNTMLRTNYTTMSENADNYIFNLDAGLSLFDGNVFAKSVGNATSLFYLLTGGKVGDAGDMSYQEVYQMLYDALNDNEITGKPSITFEILISELMRTKNDHSKPFRLSANSGNQENGFEPINIREIPRMQSPVSALMSENIFDGIVSIVANSKNNTQPRLAPVEQIMLNKFEKEK